MSGVCRPDPLVRGCRRVASVAAVSSRSHYASGHHGRRVLRGHGVVRPRGVRTECRGADGRRARGAILPSARRLHPRRPPRVDRGGQAGAQRAHRRREGAHGRRHRRRDRHRPARLRTHRRRRGDLPCVEDRQGGLDRQRTP